MIESCPDLERFMRGEMNAAGFAHREHIRMGFEMLRRRAIGVPHESAAPVLQRRAAEPRDAGAGLALRMGRQAHGHLSEPRAT